MFTLVADLFFANRGSLDVSALFIVGHNDELAIDGDEVVYVLSP